MAKIITIRQRIPIQTFLSYDIEDAILQFEGGSIFNNSEIAVDFPGKNTTVQAPRYQIFEGEFNFTGSWHCEEAYPEWFGAVCYDEFSQCSSGISSTTPINKAIKFKGSGIVSLSEGYYNITNVWNNDPSLGFNSSDLPDFSGAYLGIVIYDRVVLKGIPGNSGAGPRHTTGTVLVVHLDMTKMDVSSLVETDYHCPDQFAVICNVKYSVIKDSTGNIKSYNSTWLKPYTNNYTGMEGVFLINRSHFKTRPVDYHQINGKYYLPKAVAVGGGATFKDCRFSDFANGILWTDNYADQKLVINCTFGGGLFNETHPINDDISLWANRGWYIDCRHLGDAIGIYHNGIHDNFLRGIRLQNSGGAVVDGNIINTDVNILNCKGIHFNSNHMENGSILVISSEVSFENNFLKKKEIPKIVLYGSPYYDQNVVRMNGNLFLFYDNAFYTDNTDPDLIQSDLEKADRALESPYDIAFAGSYRISINQSYRYYFGKSFGKMYSVGLKFADVSAGTTSTLDPNIVSPEELEYNDCHALNKYSYILSSSGNISQKSLFITEFSTEVKSSGNNIGNVSYQDNNAIFWEASSGYYEFDFQKVIDSDRGIVFHNSNTGTFQMIGPNSERRHYKSKYSEGNLLLFYSVESLPCNLRILRRRYADATTSTVDEYAWIEIPVTGEVMLYDSGLTITGIPWQISDHDEFITENRNIINVDIKKDYVVAYCNNTTKPSGSGWQSGKDMIVDLSTGLTTLY